jgi:hypothetical protein
LISHLSERVGLGPAPLWDIANVWALAAWRCDTPWLANQILDDWEKAHPGEKDLPRTRAMINAKPPA